MTRSQPSTRIRSIAGLVLGLVLGLYAAFVAFIMAIYASSALGGEDYETAGSTPEFAALGGAYLLALVLVAVLTGRAWRNSVVALATMAVIFVAVAGVWVAVGRAFHPVELIVYLVPAIVGLVIDRRRRGTAAVRSDD